MTTQIKAKLLQHFAAKKKGNGGFTLIELLVVIIIIGILSAIALPSFLNQANKAKQSEAKTYVGSANRAQQAYYLENGKFVIDTPNFGQLGLGIETKTANYLYEIKPQGDAAVRQQAIPAKNKEIDPASALKAYAGAVKIGTIGTEAAAEATTLATLCEALASPIAKGAKGTEDFTIVAATEAGAPACPVEYKNLGG
ncbi:MAG: general secretion pathway protein GspH [Leptolyngbya foveolarum]|uniref:General secretion pathway protein GspH n=1 Tax=Leptolyngbya foveolarum TaxID=47253 RepID=A0A2W4UVF7_9CYAN|nr:MAG: general secretion pathway protein GspH [Leptolyngbya foveolarum]